MSFISKIQDSMPKTSEKVDVASLVRAWANILLGCVLMSVGYAVFINPYNIVPGGVYGLSIVMHNIFPSIQVGYFGYMFDIPLLIISLILLGSKFGGRTAVSVILTPFLMNIIERYAYPNAEALRTLDPSQLLGGVVDMTDHLMLTCIMGAVIIGLGCGLMVRGGATSGGTDVIGMIMQKYLHTPFSSAILICDGTVVGIGLLVIGFGVGVDAEAGTSPSWLLSLYSLISVYVISRTVAFVISGSANDKIIFVISDLDMQSLHDYVLRDLDRTATLIKSSGLYNGKEKEMLFLVVSYKEVQHIKHVVKKADPKAFVVVTDAYDTYGEGWKTLPSENEVQPE